MSKKSDQCTRNMMAYVNAGDFGVNAGGGPSSVSPYTKTDGRVYINSGCGEVPFNGRQWNGKCYAYYINGIRSYFRDTNGNACCEFGYLGNQDTSNGH